MFGWVNRATLPLLLRSSAHPASVQMVRAAACSQDGDEEEGEVMSMCAAAGSRDMAGRMFW